MCLEGAPNSVSQELPGGAPPAVTGTFAQGQGSPGGHDWLEDATQAAHSGPMLTIAWHFLLPGPVSGGFTGWLTEVALRERGIEREERAGVGAAGRWAAPAAAPAASCPQAGGEEVLVPLCTDSG